MIAALTGMALCVIGIACASAGLAIEVRGRVTARRARAVAVHRVTQKAALRSEIAAAVRARNFRHNAHCPTCGRFARRLDENITHCARHGIVVRAATGPIPIILVARAA